MREIPFYLKFNDRMTRITPAYAGNTSKTGDLMPRDWDHPRVCGKYEYPTSYTLLSTRITPAYAGNTHLLAHKTQMNLGSPPRMREIPALKPLLHLYQRDHPRVCGKYNISLYNCVPTPGSPPRVREKHTRERCDRHAFGITPACAGKTVERKQPRRQK